MGCRLSSIRWGTLIVSVLIGVFFLLSANSALAGSSNVTIEKIRIWHTGEIYLLLSGSNLDPANCAATAPGAFQYWLIQPTSDVVKARMYTMALTAKTASKEVRVEIDPSVCVRQYPIIQMIELE
jgi:hypothetical protein